VGPPLTFRQNETPSWRDSAWSDENGILYPSPTYALAYVFAGPSTGPVTLTGVANSAGWITSLDAANSAKLFPGTYWWQAVLTGTGVRRVIGEGQISVETDYAMVGVSAHYDGRTTAEKALDAWEQALSALTTGSTKSYAIADRQMTYHDLSEIQKTVDYWRGRVTQERSAATGGKDRFIQQRFTRV